MSDIFAENHQNDPDDTKQTEALTRTAPSSPQDVEGLKREVFAAWLSQDGQRGIDFAIDEMIRRGWRLSGDGYVLAPEQATEHQLDVCLGKDEIDKNRLFIAGCYNCMIRAAETPSVTGGGE